ncbi:MAG: hypothetical protein HN337_05000 [Deltaproteobacteria bacterium]|jgi:hypothetical protein|nr:hypothetical protein [Deltaproteobacteria bacterium]
MNRAIKIMVFIGHNVALLIVVGLIVLSLSIVPDAFAADGEPATVESDGCNMDADCDGLLDEAEDHDGDGVWEPENGETDLNNPDSDADGLSDGEERLHIGRVEELLGNEEVRIRFPDRLDPLKSDSDGDCIPDGVEVGVTKEELLQLIDRMPSRPKYIPTSRCKKILDDNLVSAFENVISYDDSLPGIHNVAALFDLDVSSMTDPSLDDTDDDGVVDGLEDPNFNGLRDGELTEDEEHVIWLEMDPLNPDSDNDGLLDGEEGDRDGDGEINGSSESDPIRADSDGDGVSDGDEVRAGTLINECDTDGDGLSDGVEMGRIQPISYNGCHGLQPSGTNFKKPNEMNPLNPDSDGDGLEDGLEDLNANGWVDHNESDPSIVDTDSDGLSDGVETLGDFDGDGIPDFDYRMVIGEGECSSPEMLTDIDCDGVSNARDGDSDGDSCPDLMEGGWLDANTNGIPDVYDPKTKVCPDDVAAGGGGGGSPAQSPEEKTSAGGSGHFAGAADGGACSFIANDVRSKSNLSIYLYIVFMFIMPCILFYGSRKIIPSLKYL